MNDIDTEIRKIAQQWIKDGTVDVIIGYRNGSRPHRVAPFMAKTEDDTENLIFSPFCYQNLVTYIKKQSGKIGVILRGCDGKAFLELMKENSVDRDRIKILAVSCPGVFDKKKLRALLKDSYDNIEEVVIDGSTVHITAAGKTYTCEYGDLLPVNCCACTMHISPVADVAVGKEPGGKQGTVPAPPKLSADERWEYFREQMQKCIRCYACRNVCPMCGCETCFVDSNQPQWIGKSIDESDVMLFHMVRALHLAGRCVSCGACKQACPVGVDMGFLNRRMKKSVLEKYGYSAGTDPDADPVLQHYDQEDPEDFIE